MNDQEKQVNAISEMLLIQNYLKAKRDLFRKKINTIPILKKCPNKKLKVRILTLWIQNNRFLGTIGRRCYEISICHHT